LDYKVLKPKKGKRKQFEGGVFSMPGQGPNPDSLFDPPESETLPAERGRKRERERERAREAEATSATRRREMAAETHRPREPGTGQQEGERDRSDLQQRRHHFHCD